MPQVVVLADTALPGSTLEDARELARSFAGFLGEPVTLALADSQRLACLLGEINAQPGAWTTETVAPRSASPASMSSAPFVYREDGRPDWGAMWEGFCELALYGGPPHRGADAALQVTSGGEAPVPGFDPIAEIRRGIWETTGLFSEPAPEPGWLAVTCHSKRMAAWLAAAIILENVDARCDDERLLVPASPTFRLKDEVKSVITVVAKTNHYWQAHVLETAQRAQAAD
jgi:sirohydrochlorin cobaltochelatase